MRRAGRPPRLVGRGWPALLVLPLLLPAFPAPAQQASQQCAVCHYSWMPEFLQEGRSGELAERPRGPMVNSESLCFSCHDGSVVDSRAHVFLEHGHATGVPLSPEMEVAGILPLDDNGRIACETCHTAHGTDMSRTDITNAIFLRFDNTDSELCMTCHTDKDHGVERGDHPVAIDLPGEWPEALAESDALRGQRNDVICQSCHAAHGSARDALLVLPMEPAGLCSTCHEDHRRVRGYADAQNHPDAQGCGSCHMAHAAPTRSDLLALDNSDDALCLRCHVDMDVLHSSSHALRETAPGLRNINGNTPTDAGSCSGCHVPHRAQGPMLWAREPAPGETAEAALCLSCHAENAIAGLPHIGQFSHPVGVSPTADMNTGDLVLYGENLRASPDGQVVCSSCHIVHRAQLRMANTDDALCRTCHTDQVELVEGGAHDFEGEPLCGSCHVVHRGQGPMMWAREPQGFEGETVSALCGACHHTDGWEGAPPADNHLHPVSLQSPAQRGNLPLQDPHTARADADGALTCLTCHEAHRLPEGAETITRLPVGDAQLCTDCHRDQAGVVQSAHGERRADQLGVCGSCHRFIDETGSGSLFRTSEEVVDAPDAVAALCESCHDVSFGSHPRDVTPPPERRPEQLPLFDAEGHRTEAGLMTCATCHNPHEFGHPLYLRTAASGDGSLCADCHQSQGSVAGTQHDLRDLDIVNIEGVSAFESTVCSPCHAAHPPGETPLLWAEPLGPGSDFTTRACTSCHRLGGSATPINVAVMQHPTLGVGLANPQPDLFGVISPAQRITCATCHSVHHSTVSATESEDGMAAPTAMRPTGFLRSGVAASLCSDCHGREALMRFLLWHERAPSPG